MGKNVTKYILLFCGCGPMVAKWVWSYGVVKWVGQSACGLVVVYPSDEEVHRPVLTYLMTVCTLSLKVSVNE